MAANYMCDFDFSKLENYASGGAVLPSPDQYVGQLNVIHGLLEFKVYTRDTISYENNGYMFESGKMYLKYNIMVVLESPHRFEYDENNKPVGLVMGKTGDNFFRLFTYALEQSSMEIKEGSYNVILSNAIQYQTSCGLNPIQRDRRDRNWLDIYENHCGEDDFIKRIFSIKPRYTLNLCSGGRNPEGLRNRVNITLDTIGLKRGKTYTEGNHPASWDLHGDSRHAKIL